MSRHPCCDGRDDLLLPSAPRPDPSCRQDDPCSAGCRHSAPPGKGCRAARSAVPCPHLLPLPAPGPHPRVSPAQLAGTGRVPASSSCSFLQLCSVQQDMGCKAQQDQGGGIAQVPELGTWLSELANRQTAVKSHPLCLDFILSLLADLQAPFAPQDTEWGLHSGTKPAEPGGATQGQSCLQ